MDDRLREIDFGTWSGLTIAEVKERDAEGYARQRADYWNVAPGGGECVRDLMGRAISWLESVTQDTIAVSHGGISRCLRAHIMKLTPEEQVQLDVPQDKVMLIETSNPRSDGPTDADGYKLTWL
jgi:broad specificity phosphatase PhoE